MLTKLVVARLKLVDSEFLDKHGLNTSMLVGQPIPIKPKAWLREEGLSHYGFVLNFSLKQLQDFEKAHGGKFTIFNTGEKLPVEKVLFDAGLEIHPDA